MMTPAQQEVWRRREGGKHHAYTPLVEASAETGAGAARTPGARLTRAALLCTAVGALVVMAVGMLRGRGSSSSPSSSSSYSSSASTSGTTGGEKGALSFREMPSREDMRGFVVNDARVGATYIWTLDGVPVGKESALLSLPRSELLLAKEGTSQATLLRVDEVYNSRHPEIAEEDRTCEQEVAREKPEQHMLPERASAGPADWTQGSTVYQIVSRNVYGKQPASVVQGKYPFSFVLEPYRETGLSLTRQTDGSSVALNDVASIVWTVNGNEVPSSASHSGMMTMCTKAVTTQTITATITELDGTVETPTVEATCIYVRRALTDLTERDQEIFLDAMETVYRIDHDEGVEQYGNEFKTIDDFQMLHLDGAGRIECDGWHDNAGVFPHHSAFTLLFEQNLQLIDPSIALPHWDYFLDGDDYGYDDLESIPALQEFGNFRAFDDEEHPHQITKGRFADLPIRPAREGFDVKNPYGLLRSPWNLDSTPTIRRYSNIMGREPAVFDLPGCSGMATCYSESSYGSFSSCAADAFHGAVHAIIGGMSAWSDELATKLDTLRAFEGNTDDTGGTLVVNQQVFYFKKLWRHGFTRCPSSCDATDADSISSCACSVSKAMRNRYSFERIMSDLDMIPVAAAAGYMAADKQIQNMLLDVLGSSMYVGDMFTSAAPADPTFWLVHSPMERLYHVIQDEVSLGIREFNSSWGYTSASQASEDAYVCDWSDVDLSVKTALPVCTEATCTGHNEDDMLTMGNFLGKGETYTNAEYLQLLDISNEERPFIFDSLTGDMCDIV